MLASVAIFTSTMAIGLDIRRGAGAAELDSGLGCVAAQRRLKFQHEIGMRLIGGKVWDSCGGGGACKTT